MKYKVTEMLLLDALNCLRISCSQLKEAFDSGYIDCSTSIVDNARLELFKAIEKSDMKYKQYKKYKK